MLTTIVGNFIDSFGNPIPNASFKFTPSNGPFNFSQSLVASNAKNTITDANGNFTSSIVPGSYNVLITMKNSNCYNTLSSSFHPNTNLNITVPTGSVLVNINNLIITSSCH